MLSRESVPDGSFDIKLYARTRHRSMTAPHSRKRGKQHAAVQLARRAYALMYELTRMLVLWQPLLA